VRPPSLPGCLLVFPTDDRLTEWAKEPIDLGGDNQFVPYVLERPAWWETVNLLAKRVRASPLTLPFSQEFCNLPLNPRSQSADVRRTNGMRFPLSAKHRSDD